MKLDSIDRAIIAELSANARISNLALADKVHLTPGPCLRRVQRLEAEGIILGYSADIHPAVMNRGFEVTVDVTLSNFDRSTVDNFESSVAQHDEVLELHRLFGSPDYFVRIGVADLEAYEQFLSSHIQTVPGIAKISSRFAMKVVKPARPQV
ncbi:leucine-responsive transcriptional activator, AsnC-family [Corynebacterium glutamicum MB001]|nr:Lrp/AsnC family transcriptional regulator [Corynebacterium glutamicum]AAM46687.1 Lrp-like regulator [Corynebacterium glutamicum]AGT04268.1 leucine-responsive transcriptional activator, AsnC-family [Corynebacterium glutamicum MB001]ASW13047.1 leucine-responsive transcriptional activator, AsnC-family [Corynebacterium glutamicum]MBA4569383.1 Lrp/AsnC family transcriptional regulator [Corynebacterium glutamicum]MBA4573030.1 Lrp/AsnC family transcriptional regulator [Corynebacterium glutamicum]